MAAQGQRRTVWLKKAAPKARVMPSLSKQSPLAAAAAAAAVAGVLGVLLGARLTRKGSLGGGGAGGASGSASRATGGAELASRPPRRGDAAAKGAPSRAAALRELLSQGRVIIMPCVYDGITARLVERAGFELTFMTGFGVSAARGYPDCQLVSFQEMIESGLQVCGSLTSICCIGDGDTGYGNCVNVKRTVRGYAQIGMAGVMIEDQVAPKRCGHTKGKAVVSREEAVARVRAACDARDEGPHDICILARTDARGPIGFQEALDRCRAFVEAGADITFMEAPESLEEMERYCREVPGPKLANMLPSGKTPILPPSRLEQMGYTIAAYPVSLLSVGVKAQLQALERLKAGKGITDLELDFETLKDAVGFNEYYAEEDRYRT